MNMKIGQIIRSTAAHRKQTWGAAQVISSLGAITARLLVPFSSAFAGEQQSFCGSPSQFTVPSDLANVEGDLTRGHRATGGARPKT